MGHPTAFRLRSAGIPMFPNASTEVRMRWVMLAVLGATVGARPTPVGAQWRLGVEVAGERFGGVSGSAGSPDRAIRPYLPVWWGLRTEAPGTRVRFGAAVRYTAPDLALEADDATIVAHSTLTKVLGLSPEVLVRLATVSPGVGLGASGGIPIERWDFTDRAPRWRVGAEAGLTLEAGLGGRLIGRLGGYGGYAPASPLEVGDLPESIEPRSTWRLGLRGSLLVRLGRQVSAGVPQLEQNRAPASSAVWQLRH